MKLIAFSLGLLVTIQSFGQLQDVNPSAGNLGGIPAFDDADGLRNPESLITNIDVQKIRGWASLTDFDDIILSRADAEGSVYLFDQWENRGVIEVDDKRYIFTNMNYNVRSGNFMSKISQDSVVIFDISTYDRLVINDKPFKSIYNPSKRGNEVYEVIFEGPDFSLLKGYSIHVVEANPNPMVNRSRTKITKKEFYYVKDGNSIKDFKFKKKAILALAREESGELEEYAKTNDLSFKKEDDVRRMLTNLMNN
ncbi:hypothetical protein [Aureitalea marina]|uniref:Uncharacterized protein n=1 Tax=Aureitalea marina TaxID=930804 RepID=A0A2S7KQK7_9FLAO|nr:hypothetical protein [Aureitalea marina]PQB04914.1 hypothetical protein BST85_08450 [Aureitalea marina]